MKNERGQSLVELAISLVVLLYLLSGAAEFGILFFQYVQLRDAAQEGALYGSLHPADPAPIILRARESSDKPLDLSDASAVKVFVSIDGKDSVTDAAGYASVACEQHALTVLARYDHRIFMPFMPKLIGRETIRLNATVTDTILTPRDCPP